MKSLTFMRAEIALQLYYDAWNALQRYRYLFLRDGRGDADELMARVFEHILHHYTKEKGDLEPYLVSLSHSMGKWDGRMLPVDFLENTLSDEVDRQAARSGVSSDLVDDVLQRLDTFDEKYVALTELALEFMLPFNTMCRHWRSQSSAYVYFPDGFKESALKLMKRFGSGTDFYKVCQSIYLKHHSDFELFMQPRPKHNIKTPDDGIFNWHNVEQGSLKHGKSKRVRLIKPGTKGQGPDGKGIPCKDPDKHPYEIYGKLYGSRLVKVYYKDLFDLVVDYLEDDTMNPLKYTIGDSYICRSLGGSLSTINPSLFEMYNVFRLELLTTLLYDMGTKSKYLACGSECVYLLVNLKEDGTLPTIPQRNISGIQINLTAVDITPPDKK